jgi:hypothetical protein
LASGPSVWDAFDPQRYVDHYFGQTDVDNDAWFELVCDATLLLKQDSDRHHASALEVGSGPVLLTIILATVICEHVDVCELGSQNRAYLQTMLQLPEYPKVWTSYLQRLDRRGIEYPQSPRSLSRIVTLTGRSNFRDLSPESYDHVSMHFVTESATNSHEEFLAGTRAALQLARPGGTFLFSFMEGLANAYDFGTSQAFPSVAVSSADVQKALAPVADDIRLTHTSRRITQDRTGPYKGIIVAAGQASGGRLAS